MFVPGQATNSSKSTSPRPRRARLLLARNSQACGRGCLFEETIAVPRAKLVCEECGKSFERYETQRRAHDFCSVTCYGKWRSRTLIGENAPRWNGGKVEVHCAQCGKAIMIARHRTRHHAYHFCPGGDCLGAWMRENARGENAPHWKGGARHIDYGPDWRKQHQLALERDRHACRVCGISCEEIGQEPDVHHIIPFKTSSDNRLDNLVCLCRTHHTEVEMGTLQLADYLSPEALSRAGQLTMADMLL